MNTKHIHGLQKTRMYSLFHPNFSGTRSRSNGKKSSMWYADSRTAGCWYKENLTPYWLMKSCIQNHCKFFIPKILSVSRHYTSNNDIIPVMKNKYFKHHLFLQNYHAWWSIDRITMSSNLKGYIFTQLLIGLKFWSFRR